MGAYYLFSFGLIFALSAIVCFVIKKAAEHSQNKVETVKIDKEKKAKRIQTASISFTEINLKKYDTNPTYYFAMVDNDSSRRYVEFCNVYDFRSFGRAFVNACCKLGIPKKVYVNETLRTYIKKNLKFKLRYRLMQFFMSFKTVTATDNSNEVPSDEVRTILKSVASKNTLAMYSQASKMLNSEHSEKYMCKIPSRLFKKLFLRSRKIKGDSMVEFESAEYEVPQSTGTVYFWAQEGFVYIFSGNLKNCLAVYYQSNVGLSNPLSKALEKGPFPVMVTCKKGIEVTRKRR